MDSNVIEMSGITKRFPGVIANDNISFSVKENEVHALLGENGAGKSTLMSILFGSYDPDSGSIRIRGQEVNIKDPNTATALGIGMVHQHFKLVRNYTVTENIILGIETTDKFGVLDLRTAERRVEELSRMYGLQVNPKDKIEDISVGMQQRVEILKTLYRNANILILDEPSAVLTPQEIDELMEIIRRLKSEGKTIILITHKLKEIKAVAERCTVLRRGKCIGTVSVPDVTEQQLAEMMVGRTIRFDIDKAPPKIGKVVLELDSLNVRNSRGVQSVQNLSFSVHAGEILGLAGVDGNGQTELVYAISGMAPIESGTIKLNGIDISSLSIKERIHAGLGHIPEDRHTHGLILDFSIAENMVLKNYDATPYSSASGVLDFEIMRGHAAELIEQYDIRAGEGPGMKVKNMSGGNQQKVIIAREIALSPDVLIIVQPTRGLDVGAIEYIRKRIVEERDKGKAILLISFELDEIMNLCDRIAIISRGSIAGIFNAGEINEHQIGYMMAGSVQDSRSEDVLT
ncbi:MAG TPA: ABC transporter ATP-binding protein [Treponemataceae bacterium]|nr:ABC transporter ATP-binding protein [Treponemataceae bacterium]